MEITKGINIPDIFFKKITDFELSQRAYNALTLEGIIYLGDLVQKEERSILRTPRIGQKTLKELKEFLSALGLKFGTEIKNWTEENKKIALGQAFNSSAEILTQLKQLHIRLNLLSDLLEKIEDNIVLSNK